MSAQAAALAATFLALSPGMEGLASEKRAVTLDDLIQLKRVASVDVSPDGLQLAYEASSETSDEIYVVTTKPGSAPVRLTAGELPRWSPDGRGLAYYSRESGSLQLWILDPKSGDRRRVTNLPGGINPNPPAGLAAAGRYAWSPDGRSLAFASQVVTSGAAAAESTRPAAGEGMPLVLTAASPAAWVLAGVFPGVPPLSSIPPKSVSQLFVANVESGMVMQLTHDQRQFFDPSWSPDGRAIVCASAEGRPLVGYGSRVSNLYVVDVQSRDARRLTSESAGTRQSPAWSPDGRWIAYVTTTDHLGMASLALVPSAGGNPLDLSKGLDRGIHGFVWAHDSRSLLFPVPDGAVGWIARLDIATAAVQKIAEATTLHPWFSASASGLIAFGENDPARGHGVSLIRADGRRERVLDLNPQITTWALGAQELVRWKNSRGHDLEGILIRPVGYQTGRRYPP